AEHPFDPGFLAELSARQRASRAWATLDGAANALGLQPRVPPTAGEVYLNGQLLLFRNSLEARLMGIEMVHQHYALCENLDAVANVALGREIRRKGILGRLGFMDKAAMEELTMSAMHAFDSTVRPVLFRPTELLSGGQKQAVAIVRAAAYKAKVVIMDEPTANLGARNASRVLDMIGLVREQGAAVILISHRFNDIFAVSDRIQVLRSGESVAIRPTAETDREEILRLMMGEAEGDIPLAGVAEMVRE
ncbi:MAG: ATP-binding cassette domain-containing protein, partial [Chloroflexi bacterium]|nr:ATP-binding cassette domain-containing protein [Chloroflexota bacterium]